MASIGKAELVRLQKKYRTDARIGEQFGISRQAVHQLRQKYGIKSTQARNAKRNARIAELYSLGHSGVDIGRRFGLSVSQTYRIINSAREVKSSPRVPSRGKPAHRSQPRGGKG